VLIPLFGYGSTALVPFLIRSVLDVATSSFTALATAFLYFDLTARTAIGGPGKPPGALPPRLPPTDPSDLASPELVPPDGDPLDPASWSDEDRPAGWYVVPDKPWRMRYWEADGSGGWGKRTTKTPKAVHENWRDLRGVREREAREGQRD
jgi:hypothetical protein